VGSHREPSALDLRRWRELTMTRKPLRSPSPIGAAAGSTTALRASRDGIPQVVRQVRLNTEGLSNPLNARPRMTR
jgi:hypothetical protein